MTDPNQQTNPQGDQAEQLAAALRGLGGAFKTAFTKSQQQRKRSQDSGTISLWLLGLVPVLLACLHVMIVSRGDAETLRSLVQNLNVTALVLSTLLPLGTTILTWIYVFMFLTAVTKPREDGRFRQLWTTSWFLVVVGVIDFIAMPLSYGTVNVVLVSVFVASIATSRKALKHPNPGRLVWAVQALSKINAKVWALTFLLAPLLIWLCFLGVYLPKERLTVGAAEFDPVYILSADERWTKYMDGAHKVHIVRTTDIRDREMVGTSDSRWRKTPMDIVSGWLPHEDIETPAPQPPASATDTSPAVAPPPTSAETSISVTVPPPITSVAPSEASPVSPPPNEPLRPSPSTPAK